MIIFLAKAPRCKAYKFWEHRHPAGINHLQIFTGMINNMNKIYITTFKYLSFFILHPLSFILFKPHAEPQSRRENLKPRSTQRNFAGAPHACAALSRHVHHLFSIVFKLTTKYTEITKIIFRDNHLQIFFGMMNKINMIFISGFKSLYFFNLPPSTFILLKPHAEAQRHRVFSFLGAPLSCAASPHPTYSRGSAGVPPTSFRSAHHLQPFSSAALRLCERKSPQHLVPSPQSLIPASTHGGPK